MTTLEARPVETEQGTRTALRVCPLCEATCGLTLTLRGDELLSVRGDADDAFSHGFICPKGVALGELHRDPDRLTTPLVRRDGELVPATWVEAFAVIAERLGPIVRGGDPDAVAVYLGNPNVHNLSNAYLPALLQALGRPARYSASTLDQWPKQLASAYTYGTPSSVTVPDIDRTDHLLVLGANPLVSNGSMFTAPDMPGRLRALEARGGRLVVIDPRRTRTADAADEHIRVRPGTDAFLLAAMVQTLVAERLVDTGTAGRWIDGVAAVAQAVSRFTPEAVAAVTGVDATTTRRLAGELAAAPTAAVYARIGTTTTSFGTTASWLVDVLNALTGNLDRPGGVMWALPAHGSANTSGEPGRGRGFDGRWVRRTRVAGHPVVIGESPVAALAQEIDTPAADGRRTRALVTIAGNPLLSVPGSGRLTAAVASLDFVLSIDAYVNETSSRADVVLPAVSPLAHGHYDLLLSGLSVRNVARWSPPTVALPAGQLDEWEVVLRTAAAVGGWPGTIEDWDDLVAATVAGRACGDAGSRLAGYEVPAVLAAVAPRRGPERVIDILLRGGPWGAGVGDEGLTLAALEAAPHGVDLGPLQPRLPEVLRTASGMVELAHPVLLADLDRLGADLAVRQLEPERLVLVWRRDLRSNNSWMHNLPLLVKGRDRCTLQVHPDDARRLGLADGGHARVTSRVGSLLAPVEVSDTLMPGVVSLPHGWGHMDPAARQAVAAAHPGINVNVLTDDAELDPLSGTAVLTAVPVSVEVA